MSKNTHIDKVLRGFNLYDSKKGFIPMSASITLSKSQSSSTNEEKDQMINVPYASTIGSIMYVMFYTRSCLVCFMCNNRCQLNRGKDH